MSRGEDSANLPTSTASQSRVVLFQPTQIPSLRTGAWQETSFGRVKVTGRLGQRHADVMEAILHCAEKKKTTEGFIDVLVDPAKLRKTLSDRGYSKEQLWKLLGELRSANVEIETEQTKRAGIPCVGGLIDHFLPSPMTRFDPLTKKERHLLRVRLGMAMVILLEHDLHLSYDPAPIARLKYGISQAVTRHALTHQAVPNGGWRLETLILAVAGELEGDQMRKARQRIKLDAPGMLEAGVRVEDGRVFI